MDTVFQSMSVQPMRLLYYIMLYNYTVPCVNALEANHFPVWTYIGLERLLFEPETAFLWWDRSS